MIAAAAAFLRDHFGTAHAVTTAETILAAVGQAEAAMVHEPAEPVVLH